MKTGISLIVLLVLILSISGCYYDKADLVYPPDTSACDTSAIKYSTDIVSILSTNCYVCHGGAALGGSGIKLDVYSGIKEKASSGVLMSAITHDGNASPMPKGGAKLSECNISKIRTWVRNGAPNN